MSNTLTEVNAIAELASFARQISGMYVKDLKALSQEAYSKPFNENCRSVQDFTAEIIGMNRMVCTVLRGETPPERDEAATAEFAKSLSTVELAINALKPSIETLAATIESSADRMSNPYTAPWGQDMNYFQLANIAVSHIMYHDGQINFIQSLHGDQVVHWMEE